MADLISNKLKAQIKTYELELEKKKLETLLNNMDKAVVSIDVDGKLINIIQNLKSFSI